MEEKLEGLLNLLAAQTGAGAPASQPNTTSAPTTSSTPSSTRDQPDLSLFSNDMVFPNGFDFPQSSARGSENINMTDHNSQVSAFPSFTNFDKIQDVISKGVISFDHAEEALRRFQVQGSPFPFVVVPGMSLDALRRHRPFLLLAILAMGTEENDTLQHKVERELKETLSRKLIVSAEKSLDLIQGILVYLAWYVMSLSRMSSGAGMLTYPGIIFILMQNINKFTNCVRWQHLSLLTLVSTSPANERTRLVIALCLLELHFSYQPSPSRTLSPEGHISDAIMCLHSESYSTAHL